MKKAVAVAFSLNRRLARHGPLSLLGVDFLGRFTAFRHVGVFPEQIVHWEWLKQTIEKADRPLKVETCSVTPVSPRSSRLPRERKSPMWTRRRRRLAGARENQRHAGL